MTFAAAYAKERDLKAFSELTTGALGARCTFKTLSQLFPDYDYSAANPVEYPNPIITERKIDGAATSSSDVSVGNGVNYYGGFVTYIDIPDENSGGYHYFVTHDNRGTASDNFEKVAKDATAALYVHVCDVPNSGGGCQTEYEIYLDTQTLRDKNGLFEESLKDTAGNTLAGSDNINLIQHKPSMQSLGDNNLNGAISCTENYLTDLQYDDKARKNHNVTGDHVSTGPTCELTGFEKTWYFGVQSKCQDDYTDQDQDANKIFAWYKYPEAVRTIRVTGQDRDSSDVLVYVNNEGHTEGKGGTPVQILFASPTTTRPTQSTGLTLGSFEEFSSVKSVTSNVFFSYTGDSLVSQDSSGSTQEAPSRCTLNTPPEKDTDAATHDLDDSFSTACKASATAQMVINFRDAPSNEQCGSSPRVAQIEFSLVQFVRIHEKLTPPTIYNNTAQQFYRSEDRDTISGISMWSCLDSDNCELGDPYQVLGHKIEKKLATEECSPTQSAITGAQALNDNRNDECDLTIDLSIVSTPLVDPRTLGVSGEAPWSYVMGIADFAISDCGDGNFEDHVDRGEYKNTTNTTNTRRLGASVSKKPGARHTQLHYGSYKGY